jgi:hypothetical protein
MLENYGHLIDGDLGPALDSHGTAIDRAKIDARRRGR